MLHNKIKQAKHNNREQGDKTLRAQQPRLQVPELSEVIPN